MLNLSRLFKQKIFKDFKNSVNYQLEGKDFDITSPTYGKTPVQKLNVDEYFAKQQIDSILLNRLNESIDGFGHAVTENSFMSITFVSSTAIIFVSSVPPDLAELLTNEIVKS